MTRKDLLTQELDIFVKEVKNAYQPKKIILFGSMASGKTSENSDLDIIVVAPTKDDFWSRLKKISKLCSHQVGMDILFYTPEEFNQLSQTRSFFKKEIQEKGKILYEQN